MKSSPLSRALPALAVTALLCIAAAAPSPPGMGAPQQLYPLCDQFAFSGGGDSTTTLGVGLTLHQPLPGGIATAACSLHVQGITWSFSRLDIEQWDPLTLAPDPTSVALRSVAFDPSSMQYYTLNRFPHMDLVPPLVTRSVDGVAEPARLTTALRVAPYSSYTKLDAYYDPASASVLAGARLLTEGGPNAPLPGVHPVAAHAICDGDADLQALRVAQSVMHTDVLHSEQPEELVQRFRVPEPVELRWVELAGGLAPSVTYVPGVVGIVDGEGLATPPQTMPSTLVEAFYAEYIYDQYYNDQPRWTSHIPFDHSIVLQPFHDYWLYVRSAHSFAFYARTLTGAEGADFTAGVGPFYTRIIPASPWTAETGQALAFRIVGRPTSSMGVVTPPRAPGFALRVSPNPAARVADVSWSGAVGPVRLEVLDARGRRVASAEGGAAGAWHWGGAAANGGPLPAGVYFVHARDTAGGHAVERLVVVR